MTINPMDDDCEYDAHDDISGACDFLSPQQLEVDVLRCEHHANDVNDAVTPSAEVVSPANDCPEPEAVEPTTEDLPAAPALPSHAPLSPTGTQSQRRASAYPLYECAPLLELSISDAELDLLISSLPAPPLAHAALPEDDETNDYSADAKHRGGASAAAAASEMQWVLSFLTNPDDAAQHDAEAKRLIESLDKREDDNYQFFLQELSDANLLVQQQRSPVALGVDGHTSSSTKLDAGSDILETQECRGVEAVTAGVGAIHVHGASASSVVATDDYDGSSNGDDDDEESDSASGDEEEDDDWEVVRRSIKSQVAGCSKRTAATSSSARRDSPPPPAPTRFTRPRGAPNDTNTAMQSQSQRVALSREIGDLLQTHGAFQFPKRLFPHHNDSALDHPEHM